MYLHSIRLYESPKCQITSTIIIAINIIRPLLHLNHLRIVEFETRSSLWIDNDVLKKLVKAWPSHEKLWFNQSHGCHNPTPGATILGLVEFVDLCPRLTTLCIGSVTLADVDLDLDLDLDTDVDMDALKPCRSGTLGHLSLTHPPCSGM
ncbi:uncharacterized protein EDB91DRAFT_173780 [Suillus paluster]|uniref:uncharacterized protein n=1 Tax=Suillus paluster TaxID=48578 RepID=UPI001B873215|nr:uncharacterized protein EDB91DRAFT_173780 [Suillus paluster]KAG1745074.1 hypothetical protein EDB91DRAFT_173780 [Suillus paluster]